MPLCVKVACCVNAREAAGVWSVLMLGDGASGPGSGGTGARPLYLFLTVSRRSTIAFIAFPGAAGAAHGGGYYFRHIDNSSNTESLFFCFEK